VLKSWSDKGCMFTESSATDSTASAADMRVSNYRYEYNFNILHCNCFDRAKERSFFGRVGKQSIILML
jgi:hypothetical protein